MEPAELASAAPEMLRLAHSVIRALLEGDNPFASAARAQWSVASANLVNVSSCGFYVDISVPEDAARLPLPGQGMGEAIAEMRGEPTWCMLYATDGALRFLEVSNAIDWSQPPVFGELHIQHLFHPRAPQPNGHGA